MNHGERAAYTQAKAQGLWIYEVRGKEWYSPDEFEKRIDEKGSFGHGSEFDVRDPLNAITEARQKINGLTYRTNQFESRVFEWCRRNIR